MCGIFGIISNKNIISDTLQGISNLEYRGYDSAGIGYLDNDRVFAIKEVGEIQNLLNTVNHINPVSTSAIAHTRWATHGSPSIENSHPFVSDNGKFALVHNGIIENYNTLKATTNTSYVSSTDSEVILKLIEKYYDGNMLKTIRVVCDELVGSYAIAIISAHEPDKIYVAKHTSPCVVGITKDESRVCSDINGIGQVDYAYILEDDNIAVLTKDQIHIYDKNLTETHINKTIVKHDSNIHKGEFEHFMRKEIFEIPETIKNTCLYYPTADSIMKSLPKDLPRYKNILIIGCGTAYHAGLMGKKIIEQNSNLNVKCEIASEFIYSKTYISNDTLAIFVSQSGETADTIKALNIAKQKGATTLAITNVMNSSITFAADYCLYTHAGVEIAVASTKAYIGQLTIFYLLGSLFNSNNNYQSINSDLLRLSLDIPIESLESVASEISSEICNEHDIYMIGRNTDFITASESSLKLKEISYIHSEAYPSGELKHGTISLLEQGTFLFIFITEKDLLDKSINNATEAISRGANVIVITQFDLTISGAYKIIKLQPFDEYFMPISSIILMQFVAYHTSIKKELNPDKPRSLAKSVTVE